MYRPSAFAEDRVPLLHDAIRRAPLANLVTVGPDGPEATPLPLLLDPDPAPYGTLVGHLSRANPQWRNLAPGAPALAIVMGPAAYVSPAWYPSKAEGGRVVPTWNYVTVHAHGQLALVEDPEAILAIVAALTDRHEAGRPEPWSVGDAPADFIRAQLKGIVGVRLTVTRLEGKWKMSQNRPAADRGGVIRGLLREGGAAEAEVARVMAGDDGAP